jgi:hypothetical protein
VQQLAVAARSKLLYSKGVNRMLLETTIQTIIREISADL